MKVSMGDGTGGEAALGARSEGLLCRLEIRAHLVASGKPLRVLHRGQR